jgi:hypothetical protein
MMVAEALGKYPREVEEECTYDEIMEWLAYFKLTSRDPKGSGGQPTVAPSVPPILGRGAPITSWGAGRRR